MFYVSASLDQFYEHSVSLSLAVIFRNWQENHPQMIFGKWILALIDVLAGRVLERFSIVIFAYIFC